MLLRFDHIPEVKYGFSRSGLGAPADSWCLLGVAGVQEASCYLELLA